ncbi:signal transducer and activator of transcription 2-like [Ruditapes philippinarum]|uniref:signal transducer and activator of transcription 2-like n=1 Tax=Ruditapes philippinarum TaxID=129788 RepID=UPI00295C1020|nr:signal transducer and activator of transcription 2-like [Ruditapes philippinarum]
MRGHPWHDDTFLVCCCFSESDTEGVELLVQKAQSSGLTFESIAEQIVAKKIFMEIVQGLEKEFEKQDKPIPWAPLNTWTYKEAIDFVSEQSNKSPEDVSVVEQENVLELAPEVIQEAAPEVIQEAAPEVIQEAAPEVIQEAAPEVIQEAAPEVIQEVAPEVIQEVVPEVIQDGSEQEMKDKAPVITDDSK